MSDPRTDLENVLTRLEAVYDLTRRELAEEIARDPHWGAIPEQMKDSSGRYILLDALTAIVNGRTALLNGSS
jgi:hypothetical protein